MEEFENLVFEILDLFYLPHEVSKQFQNLNQLQNFASLADALKLLQHRRAGHVIISGDTLHEGETVSKCLQSLLFIWATLQENEKMSTGDLLKEDNNALHALNSFLHASRHIWANSENHIFSLIWETFAKRRENMHIAHFVTVVTESFQDISPKALRGAEQCLLNYWHKAKNPNT
jgi:hypothetical protein